MTPRPIPSLWGAIVAPQKPADRRSAGPVARLHLNGASSVAGEPLVDPTSPRGSRSFLQLLLDEAPLEAFEEELRVRERLGASTQILNMLRAESNLALRLRSQITRHRQREAEFTALLQTAKELTGTCSVDEAFTVIVKGARQLLGADLAYASLVDEESGDVYIRAADGSISLRFRQVRFPVGASMVGLVVKTGAPCVTGDYETDDRFAHSESVDEAVTDEGVQALVCVPLLFDGRVIGALSAGNRHSRPFRPVDVALLNSLAEHASIGLATARLFERTNAVRMELDASNRLIRAQLEADKVAADAHARLTDVLLQGTAAQGVADVLSDVLGGEVSVLDPDGRVIAETGTHLPVAEQVLRVAVEAALKRGAVVEFEARPGDPRWLAAAAAGSDHLSTLIIEHHEDDLPARRILEYATAVTGALFLFQRSVAEAENRVRGDLLYDILFSADRDPETLRRRARRHRVDLDDEHAVVVARVSPLQRQRAATAAARLVQDLHGLAGQRGGDIIVVLPFLRPGDAARRVAKQLTAVTDGPVTTGAAGPAGGPSAIRTTYHDAQRCLAALLALGRCGDAAEVAELGFAGLLLAPAHGDDVSRFLQAMLGPLLDYDERRGTELVVTLDGYYAAGGSHSRAGEALHVHPNTVAQRLERIGSLLGDDWKDPSRSLEIQMALRLWRLRHVVTGRQGLVRQPAATQA